MRFLNTTYHSSTKPDNLVRIVNQSTRKIKAFCAVNAISHIVVTGISGQSIGWPVSYRLHIPVCVVRKKEEKSHGTILEATGDLEDYIILDDQIESGATINRILDTIRQYRNDYSTARLGKIIPKCRGIFLFEQKPWSSWRDDEAFDSNDGKLPLFFIN